MLDTGLEQEVLDLLASGVDPKSASMRMIGYRQMLEYLNGDISLERMREKGIVATRQLAKRQLTWLRNQSNLVWWVDQGLEAKQFQGLVSVVKQYV
jgi:tRNA dimethylallyltransferase